nr:hypothetical protein Iba_chr03bCG11580 [Ipomoea batatas]
MACVENCSKKNKGSVIHWLWGRNEEHFAGNFYLKRDYGRRHLPRTESNISPFCPWSYCIWKGLLSHALEAQDSPFGRNCKRARGLLDRSVGIGIIIRDSQRELAGNSEYSARPTSSVFPNLKFGEESISIISLICLLPFKLRKYRFPCYGEKPGLKRLENQGKIVERILLRGYSRERACNMNSEYWWPGNHIDKATQIFGTDKWALSKRAASSLWETSKRSEEEREVCPHGRIAPITKSGIAEDPTRIGVCCLLLRCVGIDSRFGWDFSMLSHSTGKIVNMNLCLGVGPCARSVE